MKMIVGVILLTILVLGIISIPAADAASNGRLTIKPSDKSIEKGKQITFSGKLTDRNGEAIARSNIILWENDGGKNSQIGSGTTSLRGEYKISVTADYWDGIGNQVEIFAYAGKGSLKSPTITITIDKPRTSYSSPSQSNNYIQPAQSKTNVNSKLFLEIKVDSNQCITLKPNLTTTNGFSKINSKNIGIYVNQDKIGKISSNNWTSIGCYKNGDYSFTAKFSGFATSTHLYKSSSHTINYDLSNLITKAKTSSSSNQKTTSTSTTISDSKYKDPSYKIKSKYYDALRELESGVKLSEKSLSGISFENSDAKTKLDSAWKIRYMIWGYIDEGKNILRQSETYLKDHNYQKAWSKLHQFDTQILKAQDHISAIATELKEGKQIEDKYQDKNKSCVFGWCNTKDTTKGLDVKIKDLELKVEKIKNKHKDIKSQYSNVVLNLKLAKQTSDSKQEQQRLQDKQRQTELASKQEQQRLQEEKRKSEQRAQQEQYRLEEEQRQTKLRAQQEQQRLEEEQRLENEKSRIRLAANNSPLIKGLMNGKLSYYVQPLPSYVSQNVKNYVNNLSSWMDGKYVNGVKLVKSDSKYADFSINWVKDYQEEAIGRQVGDYLIVGLGMTGCGNSWKPFDGETVYRIMWHEVGHAMGHKHVSDKNNIMYEGGTGNKFEYDYKNTITLRDGYRQVITLCHGGDVFFDTKKAYDSSASYEAYMITPSTDASDFVFRSDGKYYEHCSGDFRQSYNSLWRTCENIPWGSKLVIYNPSNFGTGNDATIQVEIIDRNKSRDLDMSFDRDYMYFSEEYLNRVTKLFR